MKPETAKREMTTEELKAKLEDTRKEFERLQKTVRQREADEKERREAELALQKEKRLKEIQTKEKELHKLYKDYIQDYGNITIKHKADDDWWPIMKTFGWF